VGKALVRPPPRHNTKTAMALLEVKQLDRYFGGLHAVNRVDFSVNAGEIKALIGPNGAGKTTVFNLVAGNLEPHGGTIDFSGAPIQKLKPHAIAVRGVARTFQNIKLFAGMTALENVMVGRHPRGRAGFIAGMLNLPWTWPEERDIREQALAHMDFLGIADLADQPATSLAFGQQRAVEFARALASDPKLLLLDEPAAGLNIYETKQIAAQIVHIRNQGITVLIVEHDMSLVMKIADSIVVLNEGAKIAEGSPKAIQANREVIRVYLGEDDDATYQKS